MSKTKILELRATIYKVGGINKAKAWYACVFLMLPYFYESFYLGFNIAGCKLGLQP